MWFSCGVMSGQPGMAPRDKKIAMYRSISDAFFCKKMDGIMRWGLMKLEWLVRKMLDNYYGIR